MVQLLGWRVWYDDSTVFTSEQFKWEDLPRDGVLYVRVYYEEEGKFTGVILTGYDYYFKANGTNGPIFGGAYIFETDIVDRYSNASILRGKWADKETSIRVQKSVEEATRF